MSISQPPRIGPKIGPSSIGTPSTAITRPIRSGPAARVMIVMPSGISMPPPRPCSTRKAMSISMLRRGRAQHRAGGEQHHREHVEPLGAEPVGGPAGQRDHRGERQRVAGHRPGDLRPGVASNSLLEGRLRDADHGDVEDRHDRAEHHDAGDQQDVAVELVGGGGVGRWVGGFRPPLPWGCVTPSRQYGAPGTRRSRGLHTPGNVRDSLITGDPCSAAFRSGEGAVRRRRGPGRRARRGG